MNRLQLATLLSWADDSGIKGRKRLQKVVFFLQQAGCSLDCQYTLHHFGPYSRDVADACDEMVAAGLIEETGGAENGAMPYTYNLKPVTRELLTRTSDPQLQQFQSLGTDLIKENIWSLELGSTILYLYAQSQKWEEALSDACEFKKVQPEASASKKALTLAKKVQGNVGHQ